jgi:protein-tyrosine phosphatase
MAEGLFAAALPGMEVGSAGLNALSGMPPDITAIRLLLERGVDIRDHRARQLNRELCRRADLVLVMSTEQRLSIEREYPFSRGRVFKVADAATDVPDPYRQPEAAFRKSLQLIEQGVRDWTSRIEKIRMPT